MPLTRDQIRSIDDRKPTDINIPEWGGTVCIRPMTAAQRERWESEITDKRGEIRARLAVYTVCDEQGCLIFGVDDIPWLCEKAAGPLRRIWDAALTENKIAAGSVDELEKNSDRTPTDDSATGSPATSG